MVAQVPAGSQSLTRRLLLWSLGALVLVWGCFVGLAYRTGVHEKALVLRCRGPKAMTTSTL